MAVERLQEDDDGINLLDLVNIAWAGRYIIAMCAFVFGFLGFIYANSSTPIYKVDALLQLEAKGGGVSSLGMADLFGEQTAATTEMEILTSRLVLGKVIRELNLDTSASTKSFPILGSVVRGLGLPGLEFGFFRKYAWGGESLELAEFAIPRDWAKQPFILTVTGADTFSLAMPNNETRDGKVGVPITDTALGLSIRIDALVAPVGREFTLFQQQLLDTIGGLRGAVRVEETARQSSLLRLEMETANPAQGVEILNAISQQYVGQNIERSSAKAQRSLEFIETQLPVAEKALAEAENALNLYRQKQQSVDINFETEALLKRSLDLENALSQLVLEEEALKERYTVNHPTYQALITKRSGLQTQLNAIRAEAGGLPETQKEVFNLTRSLEVAQQVYLQLLNRTQELRVLQASSIGSVRIIDSAEATTRPIAPRKTMILLVSLLLGGFLGTAYVFVRRWTRKGVLTADELERTGLPVFATVNFAPEATSARKDKGALKIFAINSPNDLVMESLRSLRTALHFGMFDAETNSVMFTSAAPGAGKSFTALNLAVVAAQSGQKVCLVDADMRRGYLRRYFGVERGAIGLSEFLAGNRTLPEVMNRGVVENLTFIATGKIPPNPSELLMRPVFAEMLKTLNDEFDLIVIDAPPTLAVTDPVVMSRFVGTSIMVVRHIETALGEVEAVRKAFLASGSKISGAVLNGYRASAAKAFGVKEQYSSYRYAYQPDKDKD